MLKLLVFLTLFLATEGLLSHDVLPLSYHLRLDLSEGLDPETYRGIVQIALRVNNVPKNFTLHASDIDIKNISLNYQVYGVIVPLQIEFMVNSDGTLRIRPREPMKDGDYELTVSFEGKFCPDLEGFYKSRYSTAELSTIRYRVASTHFEAVSARKAFPCFDEPHLRSSLQLEIQLPTELHAVSNMPMINETSLGNGKKIVYFTKSPPMPTYLFAWYVADSTFGELASTTDDGVRYAIHGRLSLKNESNFALTEAPRILKRFGHFLNLTYKATGMTKLDLVALPEFSAGAMENWGLVTFRESNLLYNKDHSSISDEISIRMVIAHELAHQWFGDAVTVDWWSHTWLNEGFARFFQYNDTDMFPAMKFLTDVYQPSMVADMGSHPLSDPSVETEESIDDMFDMVTYGKGASILYMFGRAIVSNPIKSWFNKYLTTVQQSGGVANPDDLWRALDDASLIEKFKPWTEIEGHPVLMISRNVRNSSFRLSQVKDTSTSTTRQIGVHLPFKGIAIGERIYNGNGTFLGLPNTTSLNFDSKWKHSNETLEIKLDNSTAGYYLLLDSFAFYRVKYDADNWKALKEALSQQLKSGKMDFFLSPETRANLVSDALNLMISGHMDPVEAMDFAKFLAYENNLGVWKVALSSFNQIRNSLVISSTVLDKFQNSVKALIDNAIKIDFFNLESLKDTDARIWRAFVVKQLCKYNTILCEELRELPESHEQWLEEHDKELDGGLFCELVKFEPGQFAAVLNAYQSTQVPTQKRRYLSSLACTTSPSEQEMLLQLTPQQDFKNIVVAICDAENGTKTVMAYVRNLTKSDGMHASHNKKTIKKMLTTLAAKVHTNQLRKEFEDLLNLSSRSFGLTSMEINDIRKKSVEANSTRYGMVEMVAKALNISDWSIKDESENNLAAVNRVENSHMLTVLLVSLIVVHVSPKNLFS